MKRGKLEGQGTYVDIERNEVRSYAIHTCHWCDGAGQERSARFMYEWNPCLTCEGEGYEVVERTLEVLTRSEALARWEGQERDIL